MAELPNPEPGQEINRAGWIAFVQRAPVPLLLIDDSRNVLAASAAIVEMLGPSVAATGKPLELAHLQPAIEQRLRGTFEISHRNLLLQATIGWIDCDDTALIQLSSSTSGSNWLRQIDEQALAEQRSLLNAIIESSPGMIFAKDPDERYILSNRASAASYGLEPQEMIGRTDAEIVGHDVPLFRKQNQRIIATGEKLQYETSMDYFGKPNVHHLTRKAPLRNAAGEIIGVVGITTDISEQKLAEKALADRNALINAIIENLPDPIFAKDLNGQYVLANAAAAEDFGITVEQMVNRPIDEFLQPDVAAEFLAEDAAVIAGDAAMVFEKELDIRGRHTFLSTRKAPLRSASGELIGILGSAVDLTDRHNRELALQQAKVEAEEASRLKSSFLSTMSHELRTPLNAIIGFAHLLLDGIDGPLAPQQRADVHRIATGADHLLTLINDVLDLSRIEAGKLEVFPEPIAVSELVLAAIAEMRPLALERNLLLRDALPATTPTVRADRRRSIQVLINLIGNAVKFTSNGVIEVSIRRIGPWVGVAVSDTGIGIAPAAIPAIFDEFWQIDSSPSRRYGGTGLGLAISRRLAHLQNGEISVVSLEGTGSTFTYWLPAANGDALPDPASIPAPEPVDLLPHSLSSK